MRILFACSLSSRNFQICHDWNGQPPQIGGEESGILLSSISNAFHAGRGPSVLDMAEFTYFMDENSPTTNMRCITKRNAPSGGSPGDLMNINPLADEAKTKVQDAAQTAGHKAQRIRSKRWQSGANKLPKQPGTKPKRPAP